MTRMLNKSAAMSVIQNSSPTASENSRLLTALVPAVARVRQRKPEGIDKHAATAIVEFTRSDVLVSANASGLDSLSQGHGLDKADRLVVALTDEEALTAYLAQTPPGGAAHALSFRPISELAGGDPTQEFWVQALAAANAKSIALNPCGPLGVAIQANALAHARVPMLARRPKPDPSIWASAQERAVARERDGAMVDGWEAALAAGDDQRLADIPQEGKAAHFNAVGSLWTNVRTQRLTALKLARDGESYAAARKLGHTGIAAAYCGFPEYGIDTLLDGRDLLFGVAAEARDGDWGPANVLGGARAALAQIEVDWRREEAHRFIEDSRALAPDVPEDPQG
jgi:hypothetical protein